ncbi:MAG: hypothetical protein QMD12_03275 [Candidatus Aenigmarchaeota archaeon]|nr:hypothetical protein [Candidatus Aenigmarchaeota archaeon]
MLEELIKRIENLENQQKKLADELREVKELYKLKRPIEFIEVPCPACQRYHKVPNYSGSYKLCNGKNGYWYVTIDGKNKIGVNFAWRGRPSREDYIPR